MLIRCVDRMALRVIADHLQSTGQFIAGVGVSRASLRRIRTESRNGVARAERPFAVRSTGEGPSSADRGDNLVA